MKRAFIATSLLALGFLSSPVFAANTQCDSMAAEKKLAGAAKTSFLKKCAADAGGAPAAAASAAAPSAAALCDQQAADKKLAGAAKTSFVKKCATDATAPKS